MLIFLGATALIFVIIFSIYKRQDEAEEAKKESSMTPSELESYKAEKAVEERESALLQLYGHVNQQMICPHCQIKGQIRTRQEDRVTIAKTNAILSTQLKTTSKVTRCHCDNCNMSWDVN